MGAVGYSICVTMEVNMSWNHSFVLPNISYFVKIQCIDSMAKSRISLPLFNSEKKHMIFLKVKVSSILE